LLTPREHEVTQLVAEGMKNREIAHVLRVGELTVSNYLYRIFEQLGVSSRVELVLYYALSRQRPPESIPSAGATASAIVKQA